MESLNQKFIPRNRGFLEVASRQYTFISAVTRAVLCNVLTASEAPEAEVSAVIAEARELVTKTGGNVLPPRLREAEGRLAGRTDRAALLAGLREAEAMWRSMGAPDPADRLAKELASVN
jgi:hypothetical protein